MRFFALSLAVCLWITIWIPDGASLLAQDELTLTPIGTYESGIYFEGGAEISAYHISSRTLFVTNRAMASLDMLDISNPTAPFLKNQIDLSNYGGVANSVAVYGDRVALAIDGKDARTNGQVLFFSPDGAFIRAFPVGFVPDMLTFTPNGSKVLVACEGQPNDDYSFDPEGSISIIDLSAGLDSATVTAIKFTDFNEGESRADELPADVRIFGPGASVAQDLEPEFIAISPDSTTAYITLQENNALAIVDIPSAHITTITALGFKDYNLPQNAIDASNRDGGIHIQPWPVWGMYQPDAIAIYQVNGEVYLVTANEGDAREYVPEDEGGGWTEETRVKSILLDPEAFPDAATLQAGDHLGQLKVSTEMGDADGDGDYDALYAFGGRSFSIWDSEGHLIFDSRNDFETLTADRFPAIFNSDGLPNSFDDRSDDKGAEPEGIAIAALQGEFYAFIGLERTGGIMVYNISNPQTPFFVTYINTAIFEGADMGDISPEGLLFIPAENSPNGKPLLVVTHEESGTTTLFAIE